MRTEPACLPRWSSPRLPGPGSSRATSRPTTTEHQSTHQTSFPSLPANSLALPHNSAHCPGCRMRDTRPNSAVTACFCSLLSERVCSKCVSVPCCQSVFLFHVTRVCVSVPCFWSMSVPGVFLFPAFRVCFCSLLLEHVRSKCVSVPEPLPECVFLFPAVGACFCSRLL